MRLGDGGKQAVGAEAQKGTPPYRDFTGPCLELGVYCLDSGLRVPLKQRVSVQVEKRAKQLQELLRHLVGLGKYPRKDVDQNLPLQGQLDATEAKW